MLQHFFPEGCAEVRSVPNVSSSTRSSDHIKCFTCGGKGHMRREGPNSKIPLLTQDRHVSVSDEEEVVDPS
jgi:hypothetical protein